MRELSVIICLHCGIGFLMGWRNFMIEQCLKLKPHLPFEIAPQSLSVTCPCRSLIGQNAWAWLTVAAITDPPSCHRVDNQLKSFSSCHACFFSILKYCKASSVVQSLKKYLLGHFRLWLFFFFFNYLSASLLSVCLHHCLSLSAQFSVFCICSSDFADCYIFHTMQMELHTQYVPHLCVPTL